MRLLAIGRVQGGVVSLHTSPGWYGWGRLSLFQQGQARQRWADMPDYMRYRCEYYLDKSGNVTARRLLEE